MTDRPHILSHHLKALKLPTSCGNRESGAPMRPRAWIMFSSGPAMELDTADRERLHGRAAHQGGEG